MKQALHTAIPERLLSREAERASIRSFLEEKVLRRLPGSLYISGAPGTGKTACLNCVLQEMKVRRRGTSLLAPGGGSGSLQTVFTSPFGSSLPSGRAVGGADGGGELHEPAELPRHLPAAGRQAESPRRTERPPEVPGGSGTRRVSTLSEFWTLSVFPVWTVATKPVKPVCRPQAPRSGRDGPAGQ